MQFLSPRSYRLNAFESASSDPSIVSMVDPSGMMEAFKHKLPPHSQHPNFGYLTLLVSEAVLEVVWVSLPGYIVARQGMFDAEMQKFVANLNIQLFTPCLIFHKLASQLTADKLADLAIIPVIFLIQTLISFICAQVVSWLFKFKQRPRNFVIAMAVFGNSNSLPISLVISLSKTLKGLHWDKVPGDNDDEVAARGILYLLIFQQLGQLLRWSWGYNVLLKPAREYQDEDEGEYARLEQGQDSGEEEDLIDVNSRRSSLDGPTLPNSDIGSGTSTPYKPIDYDSSTATTSSASSAHNVSGTVLPTPANGNVAGKGPGNLAGHGSFPQDDLNKPISHDVVITETEIPRGPKGWWRRVKRWTTKTRRRTISTVNTASRKTFNSLPTSVQTTLSKCWGYIYKFFRGLWSFMNPPLWAMLAAIIVASIPRLQHLFFDKGTFVENSITRAIGQSGGVAVPLILVVLGANLARNTLPKEERGVTEDPKLERNILIASLICRMVLPTLFMAPILVIMAKYIPVSIVDDKIFIIVCFLLTGAPSALQLAQICQINNVYMGAMSKLLFQSYVVWILPSTLVLVMLALETVEFATA